MSARKRALSALAMGAIIAPFGITGVAHADDHIVDISANACPADAVSESPFTDLAGLSEELQLAIACLADYGVVTGATATTYNPTGTVSRAQMAQFFARIADYAGVELDTTAAGFTDIAGVLPEQRDAINGLANAGVVNGTSATTYNPTGRVSRAQMATFIAQFQAEVVGEALPEGDDAFTDDEGSVHEANINRVAAAGIAAGTSATTFNPAGNTSRANMAAFIARHIEYNVAEGLLPSLYEEVESNESLEFGPDDAVTLELSAGTTDRRSFLATGLANDRTYRVTLVNADQVSVDDDGVVTFTSDVSPNQGLAAVGAEVADIVSISNAGTIDAGANSATTTPVNGAVTVTIEGVARGSVVPVIYLNGAPGGSPETGGVSPRLELDADGLPTEPFGIAGVTTFTNPEAANTADQADTAVQVVDAAENLFEANNLRFRFDANDTFRVDGAQATLAQFRAALSVDDRIVVTDYQRNPELRSTFALTNVLPATPTPTVETVSDNRLVLTLTGVDAGSTVRVYGRTPSTGAPLTASAQVLATATADADATLAGFQVVVPGLTANTSYDLAVSQVRGGNESALSATLTQTTAVTQVSPVIASAVLTTDALLEGEVGIGDVFTLSFNRGVTVAGGATLAFRDADGDTILVSTAAGAGVTEATIAATDVSASVAGTETVTVTITTAAVDRNVAGDGTITYPLTLTGVTGITDTASGANVTLTGSDTTVS